MADPPQRALPDLDARGSRLLFVGHLLQRGPAGGKQPHARDRRLSEVDRLVARGLWLNSERDLDPDVTDYVLESTADIPGHEELAIVFWLEHPAPTGELEHAFRAHFEAAFPRLEVVWLATTAGEDQVLLVTRESLVAGPLPSA